MEASPVPPTGYGSPAAAAALEKFSGVNFDDWDYKLKAICFQQGLGDILLHPDEWQQTVAALQPYQIIIENGVRNTNDILIKSDLKVASFCPEWHSGDFHWKQAPVCSHLIVAQARAPNHVCFVFSSPTIPPPSNLASAFKSYGQRRKRGLIFPSRMILR